MLAHSIGPSLRQRERAAYQQSQAYAEHGWECPGSRMYHGPKHADTESAEELESEGEEEIEEDEY